MNHLSRTTKKMEIRQLRAFVSIAEAKTFTAGAKMVHVTQAAISMQIRQLEDEVGVPLYPHAAEGDIDRGGRIAARPGTQNFARARHGADGSG